MYLEDLFFNYLPVIDVNLKKNTEQVTGTLPLKYKAGYSNHMDVLNLNVDYCES